MGSNGYACLGFARATQQLPAKWQRIIIAGMSVACVALVLAAKLT